MKKHVVRRNTEKPEPPMWGVNVASGVDLQRLMVEYNITTPPPRTFKKR